jgi:hypothetical protein
MQKMRRSRLSPRADARILHAPGSSIKEKNMELSSQDPVLALAAGEVVTLDDARGVRIQAGAGSVWVTEEADFQDHILEPGDALVVAHDGRTIIQAMQPSWVALREAAPANDALEGATA